MIIKRFVDEKIFFFGLGLFSGEGSRRRRPRKDCKNKIPNFVEITNDNPIFIQCFLNFLQTLGFDRNRFRLRIQISCKEKEMQEMVERSTRFWQDITQIPIRNFTKPNVRIRENPKQKSENGSVNVRLFSQPLWRLLVFWLKNSKSLLNGSGQN